VSVDTLLAGRITELPVNKEHMVTVEQDLFFANCHHQIFFYTCIVINYCTVSLFSTPFTPSDYSVSAESLYKSA
jgi:hypothetical protein